MEQMVSISEKRTFLKWLLHRHLLKSRESVWLLNYILGDERLLGLMRFVDNIDKCERSMVISERWTAETAFEYVKRNVKTNDPEKAFHDLRLNQAEPIFVQLNLSSTRYCPEYLSVLEDNPHIKGNIHERFGKAAETVASTAETAYIKEKLYEQINEALDLGDKARFYELTDQLIALKNRTS
ncbi:ReoY family proteolytic degradation factor [Terrilactibacillus sp. S3-3]|nr:ReoY family proteolytic degradation factor [Terrilactibacillus sp. S3-3]